MAKDKRTSPAEIDPLGMYTAKRRFDETPEPQGNLSRRRGHVFAIQKHAARRLHYDLRLELDGVLKSWAVTKGPSLDPRQKRLAVRTEDHPLTYAHFEGKIPEGNYGAGTVVLWDEGEWTPLEDPHDGLASGKLTFRLKGKKLKGRWALVRFNGKENSKHQNWLLVKERDEYANENIEILDEHATSMISGINPATDKQPAAVTHDGKSKTDITNANRSVGKRRKSGRRKSLPRFHKPELATLVDVLPKGDEWCFELKFDGYRSVAAVSGEKVKIYSRSGLDWSGRYRDIARGLTELDLDGALLDGEIVAVDPDGRSNFSLLQKRLKSDGKDLSFFVFDLLANKGENLRSRPLMKRKEILRDLMKNTSRNGPIYYVDDVADGHGMLDILCRTGWEGVIAKRKNARYRSGRGKAWLKVKCTNNQEFIIVGWSPSEKNRPFASILLGCQKDRKLIYAGRVGSGFSSEDLTHLSQRFQKLARKTSPLHEDVPANIRQTARWLKPELVAQVAFAEFTHEGMVRHGRFLGLREDKGISSVTSEAPVKARALKRDAQSSESTTIAGVRLTHPGKVLFHQQGLTKRDLAEYLESVADRMLYYSKHRLVSLVRCPQGRSKRCFFQRHAGSGLPEQFHTMAVKEKDSDREEYLYLTGKDGLIASAQMGVLELHLWGSRIDDVERPERIVLDLDPDPSIDFSAVKAAAVDTRDALDALGLKSFPLLTGGKGIHVIAPTLRKYEWPTVKFFAKALAELLAENEPDRFVATMTKAKRKGRIFIDYFRNERSATAIAPYSPRARAGAPVAWPVSWEQLKTVSSADEINIREAVKRLSESDPWEDYSKLRQGLTIGALRALRITE